MLLKESEPSNGRVTREGAVSMGQKDRKKDKREVQSWQNIF